MIEQKQLESVEHFNCLGSMITNDARCTCEIKSRINKAKTAFNKQTLCHQQIALELQEETSKMLPLEHSFVWNEIWTLQKIDQKYLCGAGE